MKSFVDKARNAFNYRLKDDGVPHMQVKEFLAIVAIVGALVGGSAYVGNNLSSIIDWFENAVSMDEEQDAATFSGQSRPLIESASVSSGFNASGWSLF